MSRRGAIALGEPENFTSRHADGGVFQKAVLQNVPKSLTLADMSSNVARASTMQSAVKSNKETESDLKWLTTEKTLARDVNCNEECPEIEYMPEPPPEVEETYDDFLPADMRLTDEELMKLLSMINNFASFDAYSVSSDDSLDEELEFELECFEPLPEPEACPYSWSDMFDRDEEAFIEPLVAF